VDDPEMTPVAELSLRPLGKEPDTTLQWYGASPALAISDVVYGTPLEAAGTLKVVIFGSEVELLVSVTVAMAFAAGCETLVARI